jgi:hypothetical protein
LRLEADVTRLDAVIDEMTDPAESQCELLREHLETARTYLRGEMPDEYVLSLRLADDAVNCIASEERRQRLKRMIAGLLANEG